MRSRLLLFVLLIVVQNTAFSLKAERRSSDWESIDSGSSAWESIDRSQGRFVSRQANHAAERSENSEMIFQTLAKFVAAGYSPSHRNDYNVLLIIMYDSADTIDKAIRLVKAGFKNAWVIAQAARLANSDEMFEIMVDSVRAGYQPSYDTDRAVFEIAKKNLAKQALAHAEIEALKREQALEVLLLASASTLAIVVLTAFVYYLNVPFPIIFEA